MKPNPAPPFHLYLLGAPRLERAGQLTALDTRKAIALLAYLALNDQAFQRDALAALFWPELDQSRARAALRRTLSPLNKALGKPALTTTRETIGLNPDFPLWVDSRAFEQALSAGQSHGHAENEVCERCLEPLTQAARLYRGDFMTGFTLRDSPAFDDWQFFEAERLRRKFAGALERLVACHAKRDELDPAIQHARRWLALDPLHEPAHRVLMRLYAQSGHRAAALRQYRECVRILESELGVPPLEETTRLYEEILENRLLVDRLSVDRLSVDR